MTYADVVIFNRPRSRVQAGYTYSVPDELGSQVRVGSLVQVPFGANCLLGIVTAIRAEAPDFQVRDIASMPVPYRVLTKKQVAFADWIAEHYRSSLSDALALFVPRRLRPNPKQMYLVSDVATKPDSGPDAPIFSFIAANGPVSLDAMKKSGFGRGLKAGLSRLTKGGFIQPVLTAGRIPPSALNLAAEPEAPGAAPLDSPPVLSIDQGPAAERIFAAMNAGRPEVFLLHGVTGSGKTELYLRAVARALRAGKSVLILVPEISLTPQAIAALRARFPGVVSVIHSHRTEKQRWDDWVLIKTGKSRVVVGSRSALFAPIDDLGVIVVDEEHEWTYKNDQAPRYHARDAAVVLGEIHSAPVILASATPDVVSYYKAKTGTYTLLELTRRVTGATPGLGGYAPAKAEMPLVHVVDMCQELRGGTNSPLSTPLRKAIKSTLAAGEQTILFLNRRGLSTLLMCRRCGYVERCPECGMTMVFHRTGDKLLCHHCGADKQFSKTCPHCEDGPLSLFGLGTERLEDEVRHAFPSARVVRWDSDAIRLEEKEGEIIRKFAERETDILIGTQVVAKGLDIPSVTLVAAVAADLSLYVPDFRSAERTFQLLTQVAGRAGRRRKPGTMIIQTYSPDHYSIQAAASHDYQSFYRRELAFRKEQGYPPFRELVRYVYSSTSSRSAEMQAWSLAAGLSEIVDTYAPGKARVFGPTPCFVRYLRGAYRWQVLFAAQDLSPLLPHLPSPPGWVIDVDPVSTV